MMHDHGHGDDRAAWELGLRISRFEFTPTAEDMPSIRAARIRQVVAKPDSGGIGAEPDSGGLDVALIEWIRRLSEQVRSGSAGTEAIALARALDALASFITADDDSAINHAGAMDSVPAIHAVRAYGRSDLLIFRRGVVGTIRDHAIVAIRSDGSVMTMHDGTNGPVGPYRTVYTREESVDIPLVGAFVRMGDSDDPNDFEIMVESNWEECIYRVIADRLVAGERNAHGGRPGR